MVPGSTRRGTGACAPRRKGSRWWCRALPGARADHIPWRGRAYPLGRCAMSALLVGYARCSTDQQDLTAQRDALLGLGVKTERIYVDHGLTGTNRERPGLREALAACRGGDTLVVTKLDRLARSLPDARAIADELTARQISLSLGGSVYDPTDAVWSSPVQRACHGRGVRVRPDPAAHGRGHEDRQGQGSVEGEAAQTQP